MYQLLIAIQCISIVFLLVECWVVYTNWKGALHSYLFFGLASTLVNNVGYLFFLRATTEESCLTAMYFAYLGKVWITYALFMFITLLVGIHLPLIARTLLAFFNVITYVIVITTKYTGLYYKDMGFELKGRFPVLIHSNGIWHHFWDAVLILYVLYGVTMLFARYKNESNPTTKKRFLMVLLAILTEGSFLFVQIFKLVPLTYIYDITALSFPIGAIFMLIAIFKYNLLDTESIAREYVIDELSEGIIAVDAEGRLSYYNKPAIKLFPKLGLRTNEIIDEIKKAIETDEPLTIENRIYTPEANPIGRNGVNAGTLYSITDDTEHYRYMTQLEEQKRIADDANRAKSSFLANMSHEIRTPINAVLGMDEMILRESSEKEILSYAENIKTSGRTLLSLINDILDFSKIEEGRMEIIPTQYDLASCINDIVNMIRERAEKKGLKLSISVDSGTPHLLYGDEIRIKQIALNLLTNAVKYTEAGEVGFEVGYAYCDDSDDEIGLSFMISDTGIGMKEEDMEKLFSPFSRIEEKRNRSIEGTGLGMSIVRQLLSLMDSELNVKSVYGEGSEFSYVIRQKVVDRDPIGDIIKRLGTYKGEREVYQELFHAPDAHILAVDDNEVNLTVIKNLLKKTCIDIDTVLSGKEAIEAAREKHYDIAFVDHMMPDMDGIETLSRMKEDDVKAGDDPSRTVYIAMTANAVSGARERYLSAGFEDYISKPVDGRRLEEMIKKYLPKEKILEPDNPADHVRTIVTEDPDRKILVVDDDEVICSACEEILGDSFKVICCHKGEDVSSVAGREKPDLILLDINLVGMNGFEVLQELKADVALRDIPVMFITADEDREKEVLGLKNGALDFIRKPFIPEVLLQRSKRTIALDRFQKGLKGEVRKQTKRAERLTKEMMLALSHTVDAKDHYTNGHSERVAAYAAEIGRRFGKSPEEQKKLYEIGLLHDIGKIGVPEEIINKTERLTDDEFARIKEHTLIGCEILKGIKDMPELSDGARHHHERYDGKGYPDGLAGDAIPEVARIICVADCYDAMTSTRTYSDPKPQEKVRAEIVRCSGTQFDPVFADIMLSMIDDDTDFTMNEKGGGQNAWKNREQLWDADDSYDEIQIETDDEEEEHELPQWLTETDQLDYRQGIVNCGSESGFLSVLTTFHQTARTKADEIESLYERGDIENYTIKVHALKSAARIIGATDLSEMARALEAAGKEGNLDTINKDTADLLARYRELDIELNKLDSDNENLPELSDRMRREAFQTISEIAGSMDFGMMEGMLKDLKGYRLKTEDKETVEQIEQMLMQLDWEGITEAVKQVLS